MSKSGHDGITHIALLVSVQWISITVIILNAFALSTSSTSNRGLITSLSGPQDFLLLALGAVSLLGSSLLLCLHLHVYFQLIDDRPYAPSKAILAMGMGVAIVLIALWTSATSILVINYRVLSPCGDPEFIKHYGQACDLLSNAIILAFVAMGAWLLVLLAALITYTRSSIRISALFTVECPNFTSKESYYQKASYPPTAFMSKLAFHDYDMQASSEKSRGTESWCSDNSAFTTLSDDMPSTQIISLDDFPRIQEGMSCLDLTFAGHPYDEKKKDMFRY